MRRSPQTIETIEAQIAKAAIELGPNLDSFSVQDLARHAQIAIGTIYRILPSKDGLAKIVQKYAQSEFDKTVLAPIRAKGDLFERFNLVFERIIDFSLSNFDIASYLALNGFDENSNFKKSIRAFIVEMTPMAKTNQSLANIGFSLIWGPISALLLCGEKGRENYISLSPKIFGALSN